LGRRPSCWRRSSSSCPWRTPRFPRRRCVTSRSRASTSASARKYRAPRSRRTACTSATRMRAAANRWSSTA
jgi:hypothetical protein